MQDPVMRPAKAQGGEQMIGVADEITIGEKHKFDQIIHRRAIRRRRRAEGPLRLLCRGCLALRHQNHASRLYVSIVDIFQVIAYTSSPPPPAIFRAGPYFYCRPLSI